MVLRRELSIGFYDSHDHAFTVKNSKKNEIFSIYYANSRDLTAVGAELTKGLVCLKIQLFDGMNFSGKDVPHCKQTKVVFGLPMGNKGKKKMERCERLLLRR